MAYQPQDCVFGEGDRWAAFHWARALLFRGIDSCSPVVCAGGEVRLVEFSYHRSTMNVFGALLRCRSANAPTNGYGDIYVVRPVAPRLSRRYHPAYRSVSFQRSSSIGRHPGRAARYVTVAHVTKSLRGKRSLALHQAEHELRVDQSCVSACSLEVRSRAARAAMHREPPQSTGYWPLRRCGDFSHADAPTCNLMRCATARASASVRS